MNALRFAFAKRYGVLIASLDESAAKVIYHQAVPPKILIEIRRHLGLPIVLERVNAEVFNQHLVKAYETDSATAMQMAEDLGDAFNLSELMHELPKAEDLLEKQDDAP